MPGAYIFSLGFERVAVGEEVVDEISRFVVVAEIDACVVGANFRLRYNVALTLAFDPLRSFGPAMAITALLAINGASALHARGIDLVIGENITVLGTVVSVEVLI